MHYLLDSYFISRPFHNPQSPQINLLIPFILTTKDMTDYVNDHSFNPHSSSFQTQLDGDKLVITKKDCDGYWQAFIKNGAIPQQTLTTYKIRLSKLYNGGVMCGIATNAIFGVNSPQTNNECVVHTGDAMIYENGQNRWSVTERPLKVGDIVSIVVNTAKWQIIWTIGQDVIDSTNIPEHMREKDLYLVVVVPWENDVVELLL